MRLTLLGTGSADGWPNPWCRCSSCEAMRACGESRGNAGVLVDGTLLVDCGPDVPRTAARLGVPLADVRTVLLTHAHPDHLGPAALLWRSWSTERRRPLHVTGPPAAVEACRHWIGPDDGCELVILRAGDTLTLGHHRVTALAATHGDAAIGPALLYDITGPDGGRLFYASDTGPLPATTLRAVSGAAFDVVLLEETHGDGPCAGDHHDLTLFASTVAELRRRGAVDAHTRLLATHLGHHNPPPPELDRRLALSGAEALPDGAVVEIGPAAGTGAARRPAGGQAPRRTLVLGAARSGKSAEAERRLAAEPEVTYVATARPRPHDPEWTARIAAHRLRRPAAWRTVETDDPVPLLAQPGTLLIDSVGLWLAAALDDPDLPARADRLVDAWRRTPARVVAVAEEVGAGLVPETPAGRLFRDELGRLTTRLAAESDEVWQVTAGIATRLR